MNQTSITVVVWNLEWAPTTGRRADFIRGMIDEHRPDIVCLTEARLGFLREGYEILAGGNYSPTALRDRRKVLLWSKCPWAHTNTEEKISVPGRYIRGVTSSLLGPITVHGLCVPYPMSNVTYGSRDRKPWEDHERYLEELSKIVRPSGRSLVMGDFNQRFPRVKAPGHLFDDLFVKVLKNFNLLTGARAGIPNMIDHLAVSEFPGFRSEISVLKRNPAGGPRLSDHDGFSMRLSFTY